VLPQYALYATRGGFWDHYWLPCIVAFAALNAAAVAGLAKGPQPFWYRIALSLFVLWTINAIRVDVAAVRNFKEKARVQQEAVRVTAEHLQNGILVVVADWETQSEVAPAFVDFVRARGGRYRRAVLYDSRCASGPCALVDLESRAVVNGLNLPDAQVIVHLDEAKRLASWYAPKGYDRIEVTGHRRYLSLRQARPVTIRFDLPVDVRKRAA
jgi:hypothetical protein